MTLLKFELKKLLKSKLTLISSGLMILLEIYMLLLGNMGHEGCSILYDPYGKSDSFRYLRTVQGTKNYAGEMTQEWFNKVLAGYNAYINDPANRKSDEEMRQLKEEWRGQGYSEADISEMADDWHYVSKDFYTFPEELVLSDIRFLYSDGTDFVPYQERMIRQGEALAEGYRAKYPGEKGEAFARLAGDMYTDLAENVTWYYDYDTGWWNYRDIHRSLSLIVGLVLVIALSPLFTYDRARGTQSVIACSRHGRRKLVRHKIYAGFIFSAAVWAVTELIAFLYTLTVFGFDGAQTMIQLDLPYVPYSFNQIQATILTVATSFVGAMMSAAMIMLTGVLCQGQYAAMIVSGVLTLVPAMGLMYVYPFGKDSVMEKIFDFFPARLLGAVNEWEKFDPLYLFGGAIPMQYLLIPAALITGAAMTAVCYFLQKRRQPAA